MSYEIICPYCFGKMQDDEVHFRSERVDDRAESAVLPVGYSDVADVVARYDEADQEEVVQKVTEWEFFSMREDEKYQAFWEKYNGTTEKHPADDRLGVGAYYRRVIDPSLREHQRYLKHQEDGGFLIYDNDGMVSEIELVTGERCTRRVCCHCHNPLPNLYGKNPVRFISVVGISNAGKTVYLSQLIGNMADYMSKVGLGASQMGTSTQIFMENNKVKEGVPLPGSTPAESFQQPLFYQLSDGRQVETLVIYDVAGEVFVDAALVQHFAPFVQHSDGVILIIDPMQFSSNGAGITDKPTAVLDKIHSLIPRKKGSVLCEVPMAVCISKSDLPELREMFARAIPDASLIDNLQTDVVGVKGANKKNLPVFNWDGYAEIYKDLDAFVEEVNPGLSSTLGTNYTHYSYFAFSALGCAVEAQTDKRGNEFQAPVQDVRPRRVEEPLMWLLWQLGFIGDTGNVPEDAKPGPLKTVETCPTCGSPHVSTIHSIFSRYNRKCNNGHRWQQLG